MKRKTVRKTVRKPKSVQAKRGGKTKPAHANKAAPAKKPAKGHGPVAAKAADAVDGLVAASAQALALSIEPAWYGGVKFNLQLILRLGALVDQFPLPDDTEPAPVFHA
ncbi:MAG: DUF4089 domain-containing protein [Xanthobacteraceae bacterium]